MHLKLPFRRCLVVPFPSSFTTQVPILSRPAHHTRAHHTNSHLPHNPRFGKPYQLAQLADCLPEIGSAFPKEQRVFLASALPEVGNAGPLSSQGRAAQESFNR